MGENSVSGFARRIVTVCRCGSLLHRHLLIFGVYLGFSLIFLDRGVSIKKNILGNGSDPLSFVWFLSWWPWVWEHHLHSLYTDIVWYPVGADAAWMTSVPALAVLALPITLAYGPVVAYNFLIILAPALAAIGAYELGYYLTKNSISAFVCGLFYGFSTYEMSESLGHLNLAFTAAVPCMLFIVLLRLNNQLGRVSSAILFGGLLALQFYISLEVAATLMVFGGIAWVYAMGQLPDRRVVLRRLFVDGVFAGLMTGMFSFPFLFHIATTPRLIWVPLGWTYMTSARLYNLFVTTPEIVFGLPPGSYKSSGLFGLVPQYDFTTGLPLIAIVVNYFFCNRKLPAVRVTLCVLITLLLASLGPQLWIGNHFSNIILPWRLMLRVPLINAALPERFTLYSSLLVSIIVALWISGETRKRQMAFRSAFALFAWVVTLSPLHKTEAAPYSAFFRPGRLEEILGNDPRVLILPGKDIDASTFWQAENNFGFVQEGGYLGMPPSKMLSYPAVRDLIIDQSNRKLGKEVKAFCLATDTSYVLAGPETNTEVLDQLEALSWPFRKVDDVLIFTVPGEAHG